jgi:hypothetical protein
VSGAAGGWRLVRVVGAQAAPAPQPVAVPRRGSDSRLGCACGVLVVAVAGVLFAAFFVPFLPAMGSSSGPTSQSGGLSYASPPPPPGKWTAQVRLSGAVSETWSGPVLITSSSLDRSCRATTRDITLIQFQEKASPGGSQGDVDITVALPTGASGPGTYDLVNAEGSLLGVDYNQGTALAQIWGPAGRGPQEPRPAGKITGTLVLNPDGSGTLTADNLLSVYPYPTSLDRPLSITISFTCG